VLGGGATMQPELEIGAGVREFGFEHSDWLEIGDITLAEFGIGFHFLVGEMDSLRQDFVAGSVQTITLLAFN